ncbi:hypothetical protein IJ531_04980 [bacterium]|nr:hypothetical protein [bacterium]
MYQNPSEHATLPGGKKIGELVDKKGNLYDVVLKYPTDVHYDYRKSEEAPDDYKLLYNLGENIEIKGIHGSTYYKNQGTKGQDLYKEILEKYKTSAVSKAKLGYTYYDINMDGIEELIIGKKEDSYMVYDIYTMVNRKPHRAMRSDDKYKYFVCSDTFICREYSKNAKENVIDVYILVENSVELFPQVSFKYNQNNPLSPYFISYSDKIWENYSKEEFIDRKRVFERYKKFDFIPLN